jgi:hypothetical protein
MRDGRRSARSRLRRFLTLLAVGTTLSGCADIPSTGIPRERYVEAPQAAQQDSSVRVFAEGPRAGDNVYAIVSGFLEASGTVEKGFVTAREYLTPARAASWNPAAQTTVYDQTAVRLSGGESDRIQFSAPAVGFVDAHGSYTPAQVGDEVTATLHLTKVAGDWRIDALPPGLYVSRQDFQREFAGVNVYFFHGYPRPSVLVPDPVFLPLRQDLPTALTSALLRGPSAWLAPAVVSELPPSAALAEPVTVASGVASVRLTPASVPEQGVARDNMLGQLVMTLTEDPDVRAVEVRADEAPLQLGGRKRTRLTREDVTFFLPADMKPPPPSAYFVRDGQAYIVGTPAVRGPFGPSVKLAEIAVAPGGALIAGVSKDRKTLWTASSSTPDQVSVRLKGESLRSPSFDQDGNLWIVDGTTAVVVRRVPPTGPPVDVTMRGLLPRQVLRLRVASDGTRVGLLLRTIAGSQVYLGLVTDSPSGVGVSGVRRLGHRLRLPQDIAWAEGDRMVVLAAERNAQPQPYLLKIDGSEIDAAGSLADITSISAAPGEAMLAGTSTRQIFRLRPGGAWTRVGTGSVPRYPG